MEVYDDGTGGDGSPHAAIQAESNTTDSSTNGSSTDRAFEVFADHGDDGSHAAVQAESNTTDTLTSTHTTTSTTLHVGDVIPRNETHTTQSTNAPGTPEIINSNYHNSATTASPADSQTDDYDAEVIHEGSGQHGQETKRENIVAETPLDSWAENNLCETSECKQVASRMLSRMNHGADPCDDFYEYACGGLSTSRSLLPDNPEQEVQDRIRSGMDKVEVNSPTYYRHFVSFYKRCLTYEDEVEYKDRLERARKVFEDAGTMYETNFPQSFKLTSLLINLFKLHSSPLFDVRLDVSESGRGNFSLRLTPPFDRSLLLDVTAEMTHQTDNARCYREVSPREPRNGETIDLNQIYDSYIACTRNYKFHLDDVQEALEKFAVFDQNPKQSDLFHETKMAVELLILKPREEHLPDAGDFRRKQLAKEYNSLTVKQLQDKFSLVDWGLLFENLVNTTIKDDTKIQVYFFDYFVRLFEEIEMSDLRELNNALLASLAHELYVGLVASRPSCDMPNTCLTTASKLMNDVGSLLYLSTFSNEEIDTFESQAIEMFNRSKEAMVDLLKASEWAQNNTNEKLLNFFLDKLQDVQIDVGLRRSSIEPQLFLEEIPMNGDYFDQFIALQQRLRLRMFADYERDPQNSKQLWSHFSSPTKSSGVAIYGLNTVLLPLGAFSAPHWFAGAPHYVTMGALGTVITHELAHHFDNVGINFQSLGEKVAEGNYDKRDFQNMELCYENQLNFPLDSVTKDGGIINYKLKPWLSVNERMADATSLYVTHQAYADWLKKDQLAKQTEHHRLLPYIGLSWEQTFYLAQAQEHLPPFLRVNKLVSNSEQFSRVFSCQNGHAMNPVNKCSPFPDLKVTENAPLIIDTAE
ncbi:hypothetical protein B566_EDAN005972 [Ephemera danica]|nr:hypothetical protein B566_EDAN005972 [Ephemera danica]